MVPETLLITLPEDEIEKHYKKIDLDGEKKGERLTQLREWLKQQPHLPQSYSDNFMENYLSRLNNDMEACKERLINWHIHANKYEEYVMPADPVNEEFRKMNTYTQLYFVPKLSPDGYRMIVMKLNSPDAQFFSFKDMYKCSLMQMLIVFNEDKFNHGQMVLVDCKYLMFRQCIQVTPSILRMIVAMVYKVQPVRVKGLIFVNVSTVLEKILNLMKLLFVEKIRKRVFVYSGGTENFLKHVPKECLPTEFGGDDYTFDELQERWFRKFEENREWLLDKTNILGDVSKKPIKLGKSKDTSKAKKSFKNLSID